MLIVTMVFKRDKKSRLYENHLKLFTGDNKGIYLTKSSLGAKKASQSL